MERLEKDMFFLNSMIYLYIGNNQGFKHLRKGYNIMKPIVKIGILVYYIMKKRRFL